MPDNNEPTIRTVDTKHQPLIRKAFIDTVCGRVATGQRVRRTLPKWGRIHIDRQLPFIMVYRKPVEIEDSGTESLVVGEASYLMATGDAKQHKGLSKLVLEVVRTLKQSFGSVLIVEVWSAREKNGGDTFRIITPRSHKIGSTISAFEQALVSEQPDEEGDDDVVVIEVSRFSPPGLPALMTVATAAKEGIHLMGIEVSPTYRNPTSGELYPMIHRALCGRIARATKRGFYDFIRRHTTHRPPHFLALGPRAMVKAVWRVDEQLAAISNTFDLILAVTPINSEEAWQSFRKNKFSSVPEFRYRPLPLDPSLLKRRLYSVPLEKIEDPTLADLFLAQQLDLDRKITLMAERGTPNFTLTSLQLFGRMDNVIVDQAFNLLNTVKLPRRRVDVGTVNAEMFAAYANEELDYLRKTLPDIKSRAVIRKDVVGLMVSRGNLLIGKSLAIAPERVPASLAHEVGTHMVTYINARMQPFRQLYVGLPGYEEFQEGLACLSEYLAGGLDSNRIRLLAARVVAVSRMVGGASFIEVFQELCNEHKFTQRSAFNVTMRVFRGGGFTKDAVYLRGLIQVLSHLKDGGHFDSLLIGKFNLEHVPIIEELTLRRVLGPAPVRPSYLDNPAARQRLDEVRAGMSIMDLVKRLKR